MVRVGGKDHVGRQGEEGPEGVANVVGRRRGARSGSGWVGEQGREMLQGTFGIAFEMLIKKISNKSNNNNN